MKHIKNFEFFNTDPKSNYDIDLSDIFNSNPNDRPQHKTTEDYIKEIYDKIEKIDYEINGFELYCTERFGDKIYEWRNNNYIIDAKPYTYNNNSKDDDELLLIDITSENYTDIETIEKKLPLPKSNEDVDKLFNKYINIITKITNNLNKRNKITDSLLNASKTLNVINIPIEINNRKFKNIKLENENINGIPFNKIKTPDIFNIFKLINKKQPEIFSAAIYNI